MSTTSAAERLTALPGEHALGATVAAPEEHGRARIVLLRRPAGF